MKFSLTKNFTILFILIIILSTINQTTYSMNTDTTKTIIVDDDGLADFKSIQDAINISSDGYTVSVKNGFYSENLIVDKKINLVGENKEKTIIDGGKNKDAVNVIIEGVNINNFTIQNSGSSGGDCGIEIHSNYSIINNNIIKDCTIGINLRDSKDNNIVNNTILSNKDYGIYLHNSIDNLITENKIYGNRWGVFVYRSSNNNYITKNSIVLNSHYGIWISWAFGNSVEYNFISENQDYGIILSGAYDGEITRNTISENPEGVFITRSEGNRVFENNFIENYNDACIMDGNTNWNGNYWGEFRFLPKPIIDITPSIIPYIEFDLKPSRTPYNIQSAFSFKPTINPNVARNLSLPDYFDWRKIEGIDYSTPAKNQVPAPTCEAYALCSALEILMQYELGYHYEPDLSEAHLYFYAGGTYQAGGVLLGDAAEYLIDYGVPDEGVFPDPHRAYDFPFESLPGWEKRTVKISEWGWVENDVESIKKALFEHGPLVICVLQRSDFFSYKGGIYKPFKWLPIVNGHVITIVGYDDVNRCWIIKNSAGENWGEEGYVRVSYDAHSKETPIFYPFYGGTGILYIDGLYGNLEPDVPKIKITNLQRHHTYLFGFDFKTKFNNLRFVEGAVPRVIGWTNVKTSLENGDGVKFYLDGELCYVDDTAPFEWKSSAINGLHTIEVIAYNDNYLSKAIADVYFY